MKKSKSKAVSACEAHARGVLFVSPCQLQSSTLNPEPYLLYVHVVCGGVRSGGIGGGGLRMAQVRSLIKILNPKENIIALYFPSRGSRAGDRWEVPSEARRRFTERLRGDAPPEATPARDRGCRPAAVWSLTTRAASTTTTSGVEGRR